MLLPGNSAQLLRYGQEAFPRIRDAIRAARRYVWIEMYIFDQLVGEQFAQVLLDAVGRGVEVKLLYDPLGSIHLTHGLVRRLRAGGVDLKRFRAGFGLRTLLARDHRKLVVCDGAIAFTGGFNLAAQWAAKSEGGQGWREDFLQLEGPVVLALERAFRAVWRLQTGQRLARTLEPRFAAPHPGEEVRARVITNSRLIHATHLRLFDRAERSILLAHAYFTPDPRLLEALERAAGRGVQVTLLLNRRSDHWFMTYAMRGLFARLLAKGIRLFEWPERMLHSKTVLVDGEHALIGSYNLTRVSQRFSHELAVLLEGANWCGPLEATLRRDLLRSERMEGEAWSARSAGERLLEWTCAPVRRWL